MDILQLHAFCSEIEKLAGVELNLYGYTADPTLTARQRAEMNRAADDQYSRAVSMAKTRRPERRDFEKSPGFFGRLTGKRPTFDQAGFDAQTSQHRKEVRDALNQITSGEGELLDAYDRMRSLRKGPKDRTAGKLTSRVLGDAVGGSRLDTDEMYGDTIHSNYLDDKGLDEIISLYKKNMTAWNREGEAEYHKRFLDRAAALRKDPTVKGYRLEWE